MYGGILRIVRFCLVGRTASHYYACSVDQAASCSHPELHLLFPVFLRHVYLTLSPRISIFPCHTLLRVMQLIFHNPPDQAGFWPGGVLLPAPIPSLCSPLSRPNLDVSAAVPGRESMVMKMAPRARPRPPIIRSELLITRSNGKPAA